MPCVGPGWESEWEEKHSKVYVTYGETGAGASRPIDEASQADCGQVYINMYRNDLNGNPAYCDYHNFEQLMLSGLTHTVGASCSLPLLPAGKR